MPEIIDNFSQFFVTLLGSVLSGILYLKSRRQPYFILACFYGCFALAGLYWMLFTILITDAPPIFYVAEIGWVAGYLFLCLLQESLFLPEERAFRCRWMWLAPLTILPLTLYYISLGNLVYNLIVGSMMLLIFLRSLRGFVYWSRQTGRSRNRRLFHLVAIIFVVLENCLWLSSYPWVSDTWSNPYFWIDFAVTASLFSLLPMVRKAVNP